MCQIRSGNFCPTNDHGVICVPAVSDAVHRAGAAVPETLSVGCRSDNTKGMLCALTRKKIDTIISILKY